MAGAGTQASLRKALGAIKDSTTVGLAKVNSDYKELDIAIVKATNHVERPAKERHITAIFSAITATRPRADVAYCIHALARRLAKTRNWAVAIKTLIVIHRALREVDPTFHEELINYGRSRNHMLNMAHFKDDSSPNAWDYSTWARSYALFLEERLECFRVLKYDVETDRPRTKELSTSELLEQLPILQQLLHRVIACQPQGAAIHNFVIQLAFTMVASESIRIYSAISDGTTNLVDKFFDMQRDDAVKALAIYRRAGQQAERLSEFYEICKSLDIGRGEKFTKIEQPPVSFVQAMEEYVRDAPRISVSRKEEPKVVLAIEYKKHSDVDELQCPSPKSHEHKSPEPVRVEEPVTEPPDLLGLDDTTPHQDPSGLEEKNALALAIVPVAGDEPVPSSSGLTNGTSGWELALVTTPSLNDNGSVSKLGGGLDKLTLDSLYDEADRRKNQNTSYNPWELATPSGIPILTPHDPFMSSAQIVPPAAVQMAGIAHQQQALMWQQQQQMMMMMATTPHHPQHHPQQQLSNPFSNPYSMPYGSAMPAAQSSYNPHGGFM